MPLSLRPEMLLKELPDLMGDETSSETAEDVDEHQVHATPKSGKHRHGKRHKVGAVPTSLRADAA
eukprot:1169160-Amphidinium_carterae.1